METRCTCPFPLQAKSGSTIRLKGDRHPSLRQAGKRAGNVSNKQEKKPKAICPYCRGVPLQRLAI